ncbi:MAG TPA: ATP-binding protein [Longimicrobiales bacterium]
MSAPTVAPPHADPQKYLDQLEALYRLTTAVSQPVPLEQIYQEALECLQTALGAERAAVLLFDAAGVMRFKAARGLSDEYQRAVEGDTPWTRAAQDPTAFGVNDVAAELERGALRDATLAEGIRACAFIPLRCAGELLGKFMIYYNEPHVVSDEDLQLAQSVAVQIALAITRVRNEESLRARSREYKTLADNVPEVIARFDRDHRYLYINPAVERATGLKPEDYMGNPPEDIGYAPEVASLWRKRLTRVFESARPLQFEFVYPGPLGIRNYITQLVPELDEAGSVASVISITHDITERVQQEERQRFLTEVSTRLVESLDYESTLMNLAQLMIETLADGCAIDIAAPDNTLRRICVVNKDARIVRLVEELEARFPTPPDSAAGHVTAFRTGTPGLYPYLSDDILRTASVNDEHFMLWKQIDMQSCMCLPLNARGRTLGVITLVSHDRTRLYDPSDLRFAEELAQRAALVIDNARLYQEAHDASMAKSAFLATMSHELRTPLNAILGYAELLELGVAGSVTKQQRQQLERITASAWHLLTVIEEILTFSRVEAGREEVRLETVNLADLVDEAAAMVEPAAERKNLDFVVETPPADAMLRTDRGKVRQILLNLLSNAVKFTDAGRVECVCEIRPAGVVFRVTDTGQGIAPEHCDRVFDPFWQAMQGATRKAGGTGLGLTVSRQLAQLLGGDVTLQSALGKGTTFTVTLPSLKE